MSASLVLTLLLCWSSVVAAAGLSLPGRGQNSKRTDDQNPLVAVVDQLSRDLLAVKAQMAAQQNEIQAQKDEIASLKAANALTVAFSAYISDEPNVHAAKGSAALFRGLIANVGGGFSTVTSAFTAPMPGQYFFTVHADCSADFRALHVTVNGHVVFSAQNDSHANSHVTGSGLVTLQKGDVVTTSYYSDVGYLDAGNESTFSGFLVK